MAHCAITTGDRKTKFGPGVSKDDANYSAAFAGYNTLVCINFRTCMEDVRVRVASRAGEQRKFFMISRRTVHQCKERSRRNAPQFPEAQQSPPQFVRLPAGISNVKVTAMPDA